MLSATSAAQAPAPVPPQAPAPIARGSLEDMNRALRDLNADGQGVPDIRFVPRPDLGSDGTPHANLPSGRPVAVPKSFRIKEVSLNTPAREGLAMSEAWSQTPSLPAPGPDGRVLYVYGEGLPTLVCAPLRLCVIELEAGERLVGDPQIGDAVRWVVSAARTGGGPGRAATDLLIVKPKTIGLDTALLVATDRRAYYVRLLSRSDRYMARIAFDYSGETERALTSEINRLNEAETQANEPRVALESLDFGYRWRASGRHRAIAPERVFDDGAKTFVEVSPALSASELPILVLVGPDGKDETVNYRVRGNRFIVDRQIERMALIRGAGRRAERVVIERDRRASPGPRTAQANARAPHVTTAERP
ncbi:MAG: P-type conjugative transfer protein TrbG [Gemmatimonadaceae bacterium]|nr:P-type conjugative transfer protein TrbG [Gemmatimonadaceae bacterium]